MQSVRFVVVAGRGIFQQIHFGTSYKNEIETYSSSRLRVLKPKGRKVNFNFKVDNPPFSLYFSEKENVFLHRTLDGPQPHINSKLKIKELFHFSVKVNCSKFLQISVSSKQ